VKIKMNSHLDNVSEELVSAHMVQKEIMKKNIVSMLKGARFDDSTVSRLTEDESIYGLRFEQIVDKAVEIERGKY
jgi:hypothetical protein